MKTTTTVAARKTAGALVVCAKSVTDPRACCTAGGPAAANVHTPRRSHTLTSSSLLFSHARSLAAPAYTTNLCVVQRLFWDSTSMRTARTTKTRGRMGPFTRRRAPSVSLAAASTSMCSRRRCTHHAARSARRGIGARCSRQGRTAGCSYQSARLARWQSTAASTSSARASSAPSTAAD